MGSKQKRILIALGILSVLLAGAFYWMGSGNRKLSPGGTAEGSVGNLRVLVDYSRPSVRGRTIFGPAGQGAVVSYGKYWRLGANAPTSIEFSSDVLFNGIPVPAGRFRLYAIPGEDAFELVLNSKIGWSGAPEPDYEKDILRTKVPAGNAAAFTEQLTLSLVPGDGELVLQINWDKLELKVPVKPAIK